MSDTPALTTDDDAFDYHKTLNYSQSIRRQIVDGKMTEGVPKDKEDVDIVLRALKDMDSTAINDRRNNIEEKNGDNARSVVDAIQTYMKGANRSPFTRNADGSVSSPTPSFDDSRVGPVHIAPGEMDNGVITETSESFMNRTAEDEDPDEAT